MKICTLASEQFAMKLNPTFFISTAYDFAYTDEKYFNTRTWYEHAGMFAAGGAAGVGIGEYFTGAENRLSLSARVGAGAGIYAAEWSVTSLIKQRSYARYNGYSQGGFYTGNSQIGKGWVSSFKWSIPSYNILFD